MLILAFDTTSPEGGAALFREDESLGEARAAGKVNYSVALFEMVERLLSEAGLRMAEVDLFAAATGPGSFTGIRVGLAAAQGWARAFERPVRGVSVLEAMVEAARPAGPVAVPLLDARRGEFYLGVYRRAAVDSAGGASGAFALSGEGLALDSENLAALAADLAREHASGVTFIAREQDQAALEMLRSLPGSIARAAVPGFMAGALARVARQAAREGRLQQPRELDAWYIRRSDAEMNWRG